MEQNRKSEKTKKTLLIIMVALFAILIIAGIYAYTQIFKPVELSNTEFLYIDENMSYNEVVAQLNEKSILFNEDIFRFLSDRMKYPTKVKTGKYSIEPGMTMPEIIRKLRSAQQTPVKLTFNNIRTMESLAGRFSSQLMLDSVSIIRALNDTTVAELYGFNQLTFGAMFIPNTYEVYWDTDIENLLTRMKREYTSFWNNDRKTKAEKIGLTPLEISTLASIVEEEATYVDEYSTVAGLYINRLNRGMRLEADPTVKYAVGDVSLRRILFHHLEVDSPYNTYKNDGLPPGPLRIPSTTAIDATLTPDEHKYLFMCAKDDLSGRHNFAITHAEHAKNARAYQRALNERGIY